MNITNPCYKCNLRAMGCHSDCVKYKGWKSQLDRRNDQIRKDKNTRDIIENDPRKFKYNR